MKKWIEALIHLFFPQLCIVCGGRLAESEKFMCIECNIKMPRTHDQLSQENVMSKMLWGRIGFEKAAAYFLYAKESKYKNILHQIKYHNRKEIGLHFGKLMADEMIESGFFEGIDYIIPIPLHPKRLQQRGYNQSEWIAKGISEITHIPVNTSCVIRTVNTQTQTSKNAHEREENMRNVFKCVNHSQIEGKHILIIDDVFTTGATTLSCVQSIENATNCIKISIASMARAQNT